MNTERNCQSCVNYKNKFCSELDMEPCFPEDGCDYFEARVSTQPSGDLISREETLTAFADYVGSGMSMNDYDALWDIVAKMPAVKQEPKFIAKSDGTIEQIKNCNDCLFKKEWEKIGKLLSNILEKHTEQEPCEDAISRQAVLDITWEEPSYTDALNVLTEVRDKVRALPPVTPQPKTEQFVKWVATEIFDENWEYNKDAFAELACRKLAKLGIVKANGDTWELVDPQESEGK